MFILQQGWGMLSQMKSLFNTGEAHGVIMSPRVCDNEQMKRHVPKILEQTPGPVLFDPHFYEPRTDIDRILSYPFFKGLDFSTKTFDYRRFCTDVIRYQTDTLHLDTVIIPGRFTNSLSEAWLKLHHECSEHGAELARDLTVLSTIAVGPDVILNPDSLNSLVDEVINYPTSGLYFVFEHPRNNYFLDEEFLYILLDAFLSISLAGKQIFVGYGNQQSLIFLAVGADAIASGNYRNVRAFDHLNCSKRNDELRKATWYFDGRTMGEYRIPALSLAFRRGFQDYFGPSTTYAEPLLSSEQPTLIHWSETDGFAHYFALLSQYTADICQNQKNTRLNALVEFFRLREKACEELSQAGFALGDRSFAEAATASFEALKALQSDRGGDVKALH